MNQQQIYYWAHMLDEAFSKEWLLIEGKHWPEDYLKTAFNLIKNSPIGQQSWYTDNYIQQDVKTFADEFSPLSHKSSNLGFFMAIIRWFIEYSGTSKDQYQEFIERKLDGVIAGLLKIRNDKSYDAMSDQIKKMPFADFMKLVDEVNAKTSSDDVVATSSAKFKVIPIYSYEELHEKYGGDWTGYRGQSEWCHTNGQSTYESWTKDGTQMFFVIEREDWKNVKAPDEKPQNCYDEYGMSLIAILVDVKANTLLNLTSRWNHIVLPTSGAADMMFESWQQLNKAVGIDVESICKAECKELKSTLDAIVEDTNAEVAKILANAKIITDVTIPKDLRKYVTEVNIPDNVTSIGDCAFIGCGGLTSVMIPDSVTSIGEGAFSKCSKLTHATIPNSVMSIGNGAFYSCSRLTSIMIPNSVIRIGSTAFAGCHAITTVTIPNSVTSIGKGAFYGCSGLTSITIGNGVKSIEYAAFYDCSRLASMTIPDSVTSIGNYAFGGCTSLKDVIFEGKTLKEVKRMENYPWGIKDTSAIKCEDYMHENSTYALDESFTSTQRMWFHGTPTNRPLYQPSPQKPFYVAEDPEYALLFATSSEDKRQQVDNGVVHVVSLDYNKLHIFDLNSKDDLASLKLPEMLQYYLTSTKLDIYNVLCELLFTQRDIIDLADRCLATSNDAEAEQEINAEFKRREAKPETDEEFGEPEQQIYEFYDGNNHGFTNEDAKDFLLWAVPKLRIANIKNVPYTTMFGSQSMTFANDAYDAIAALMLNDILKLGYNATTSYEVDGKESYHRCIAILDYDAINALSKHTLTIEQAKLLDAKLKAQKISPTDKNAINDAITEILESKEINENKQTYMQKYANEPDIKKIVDAFWAIRQKLSTPQNDIDWWIKKPFNDLKSFVQNFDTSNKRQRRDANYKQQAVDSGAKLLGTKDGYEMWYVPTYDAMVAIGRFYKGRSTKWCVASDDPDFWFDNHEDSEFVVLVREHPQNDEFDKVAIEMMNHGRYYNEDDIIPWDLENEDWTFTNDDLIHHAWLLFKDNGETREQYFG